MHTKLFIPGPTEVSAECLDACGVPMVGHRSKEYSDLHERTIHKLQKFFGTESGNIFLFTSSSTGAMEACIRNLAAKRVFSATCGAFSERWAKMVQENGKEGDAYSVDWGKPNLPEKVDEALSTGKYDCFTVVYNETSTGLMNPIPEMGKVLQKYPDVSFCVDAVSAMAGVPIQPEELGVDVILAGVQKAFGLPPGLAVVWVSDRALEKAATVPGRGHYFDFLYFKKSAEKRQTPETPVISLINALDVQLDRMMAEGFDARYERTATMATLCREWARKHFEIFPEAGYESQTLTTVRNTRKIDVGALNKELKKRGVVIAPGYGKIKDETFRISHMADCQIDELKQVLGWIDEILGL